MNSRHYCQKTCNNNMHAPSRLRQLTDLLVDYSLNVKPEQNVFVSTQPYQTDFICSIIDSIYAKGAYPFVDLMDMRTLSALYRGANPTYWQYYANYMLPKMQQMHAYVGFEASCNDYALSSIAPERFCYYQTQYFQKLDALMQKNNVRWVAVNYPSSLAAQKAGLSSALYADLFYHACLLDYHALSRAMDPLVALFSKTKQVRIVAPKTQLTFSIENMPTVKCDGKFNMPDGEVYTAPHKYSAEGYITFHTPSVQRGTRFENVYLEFQAGKVVHASANDTQMLHRLLNVDCGARYLGEFALGVNPHIQKPVCDILFDEKILGSFHLALGDSYSDCDNGNHSMLHWDLVQVQTPSFGGGRIYFDDVCILQDGRFVLPALQALNA